METQKAILFLQTEIDGNKKMISSKKIDINKYEKTLTDLEAREKFLERFAKNDSKAIFEINGKKFDINYTDSSDPEKSKEIRNEPNARGDRVCKHKC